MNTQTTNPQNTVQNQSASQIKMSKQMRGVLMIFAANRFLKDSVLKYIDIPGESINWNQIFSATKGSNFMAAALFAYGIWTDELWKQSNPFEGALNLDREIQDACLRALALRWGIGHQ